MDKQAESVAITIPTTINEEDSPSSPPILNTIATLTSPYQERGMTGTDKMVGVTGNSFSYENENDFAINGNSVSFNELYVRSNSPMTSNCNSDVEIDANYSPELDDQEYNLSSSFFRKMGRFDDDHSSKEEDGFARRVLQRPQNRIVRTHKFVSEDEYDVDSTPFYKSPPLLRAYYPSPSPEGLAVTTTTNNYFGKSSNKKYKKFTYHDIEKSLSQYYQKSENNFSETDLLITYLSGMRTIYNISTNVTKVKSYSITMSAITVAISLTIISPLLKDSDWGTYLITSGNAFVAFLIFLSRYMKLDSNSAQYAFMARQFNKLESKIEFWHSQSSQTNSLDIESHIVEINEYIHEVIPKEVVQLFPLIYRTNIIKFMRQIDTYKKNLIIRFRDIKNEIHYILYKWNSVGEQMDSNTQTKTPQQEREKNRLVFLMDMKEKTKKELMQYNNIYIQINDLFKKEIRYAETYKCWVGFPKLFKPDYDFSNLNPIVSDYLKLVVTD